MYLRSSKAQAEIAHFVKSRAKVKRVVSELHSTMVASIGRYRDGGLSKFGLTPCGGIPAADMASFVMIFRLCRYLAE